MTKSFTPKSLVLYADDDRDDKELVREAFQEYSRNIQLLTFGDGLELLRFVEQLDSFEPLPCLIILDINMPRLNGKQTLQALRQMERFQDVPVVLFTTSTLPSEAAFARSFDAGFVVKPLHTSQIFQLVDKMVDHCSDEVKKSIRNLRGE